MSAGSTFRSTSEKSDSNYTLPLIIGGLVLLVLFLVWLFRASPGLQTNYGKRTGSEDRASVNGTIVLSDLFRQAGHGVTSVDRLSPRLRKYHTLVWFPDDFGVPTTEQRDFLEQWLAKESGRTVVYVGRDYDAAGAYWARVQPLAPPEQAAEVRRQLAEAKSKFAEARARLPKERFGGWFTLREGTPRKVTTLQGPWAAGIDARKTDITLASRLEIPQKADLTGNNAGGLPENYDTLLKSEKDILVSRVSDSSWGDGQIIVVANGSMLLNYPLINHEHRKLATKLIAECSSGNVAFVESGRGGPPVEHRATKKRHQEWPYPMNAIVFHLMMLAIVFCLARSTIFGRARRLPIEAPTDFGKHISALGKLMQRTKDQAYAYARLQQYRQHGKRDSGKSHKK